MAFPNFSCTFELRCPRTGTTFGTLTRMCNPNGRAYTCTFNGETQLLRMPQNFFTSSTLLYGSLASGTATPWAYCYEEELPRGLNRNGYE